MCIPKIDKWSMLGVATAISGKRQEMDSAIARPTPTRISEVAKYEHDSSGHVQHPTFTRPSPHFTQLSPRIAAQQLSVSKFTRLVDYPVPVPVPPSLPSSPPTLPRSLQRREMSKMAACIFCKIVKGTRQEESSPTWKRLAMGWEPKEPPDPDTTGEIPSFKLFENDKVLAFMDIQPLSKGHALVIPKHHGEKLTDIPDDSLVDILHVLKKIAVATGAENYNVLQNNGRLAHQEVDHVHFHLIPKPNETEGLGIGWPAQKMDMGELKKLFEDLKAKM
ncbi:Hit family protein 1 [Cladophialophora carrionii]|uniref:Hit family protein 1 n=1 Tax=Cladophialophora carrionii TaxID=86049 RepID=A0A1C1CWA2_9EURO|nr:Hit family protein 1 [Cladophialophora carrionii]